MKSRGDIVVRFSGRLKFLRKKYKITQEQLSEKSNVSYKNIQYLESKNPTCPSLRTLEKIAKAFGVSVSKLLDFK